MNDVLNYLGGYCVPEVAAGGGVGFIVGFVLGWLTPRNRKVSS